jgi:hypothetical protein
MKVKVEIEVEDFEEVLSCLRNGIDASPPGVDYDGIVKRLEDAAVVVIRENAIPDGTVLPAFMVSAEPPEGIMLKLLKHNERGLTILTLGEVASLARALKHAQRDFKQPDRRRPKDEPGLMALTHREAAALFGPPKKN